jgi:FkbH-like protein
MYYEDGAAPSLSEIIKILGEREKKPEGYLSASIAILRNITIDNTVTYLRYFCLQDNINPEIFVGEYDNVVQYVTDDNSTLYLHNPEFIILSIHQDLLFHELSSCFPSLNKEGVRDEIHRIIKYYRTIFQEVRSRSNATIVVHSFETPAYPTAGILDYQDEENQIHTFRNLNHKMLSIAKEFKDVYICDLDIIMSRLGFQKYYDTRMWHIARSPYSLSASKAIAREYIRFIRAKKGTTKKCLVLDCDNTLWGGILGEDGFNNIKIGMTYPGSAYREFQQAVLNLYHRGNLLAICSKNNEQDVVEVLEKHPDMLLRSNHFLSLKINWQDKVSNLKEIVRELNIGSDSLVFVDDNPFEIEMINKYMPEVKTILLPRDASQYKDLIVSCGLFDTLTFSEEDRKRNLMYRGEIGRKKAAEEMQHTGTDDYLQHLLMVAEVRFADDFSTPRISQLTQRTNQFNLTTRRYGESEIRQLCQSEDSDVLYLKLSDRFGESGIVGVSILKYEGDACIIDSFLLSCRVIGRGVEDVLLKECERLARKKGKVKLIGQYISTAKNGQVSEYYQKWNFITAGPRDGATEYVFDMANELSIPDCFKTIVSEV